MPSGLRGLLRRHVVATRLDHELAHDLAIAHGRPSRLQHRALHRTGSKQAIHPHQDND